MFVPDTCCITIHWQRGGFPVSCPVHAMAQCPGQVVGTRGKGYTAAAAATSEAHADYQQPVLLIGEQRHSVYIIKGCAHHCPMHFCCVLADQSLGRPSVTGKITKPGCVVKGVCVLLGHCMLH